MRGAASSQMVHPKDIVAIALLTREDVAHVGSALRLVFKADHGSDFDDLLRALDQFKDDDEEERTC